MKAIRYGAAIILLWVFFIHFIPFLTFMTTLGVEVAVKFGSPYSYVHTVELPSYPDAKNELLELNGRGYGEVVRSEGFRPIFITEKNLNQYFPRKKWLLGVAFVLPGYCYIILDSKLYKDEVKSVLWHEYIHCFGIDHSNIRKDIMYPSNTPSMDINTVDNYLEYIKTLYE